MGKYTSPERASLVKSLLDSMGVENQMLNDTAMAVLPHIPNAIKIIVRGEDYERAKELLEARFDKAEFMKESCDTDE